MVQQIEKSVKTIPLRDMLFGDLPLNTWAAMGNDGLPWSLFKKVKDFDDDGEDAEAVSVLKEIIALQGLESRQYLQAFHILRQLYGVSNAGTGLFGVVVEVAMEEGTDTLAVYADRTARYYNYSGNAIVWDASDAVIDGKIDHILSLGKDIVQQIGPWNGERPAVPRAGYARLNFLTAGGLHFGEAPQATLFNDPMAGKIMYALLDMMDTLINKTEKK